MSNFEHLKVDDEIGVIFYGRRHSTAALGTVVKGTPTTVAVLMGNGQTIRFRRANGYPMNVHSSGYLVDKDSEIFQKTLAETKARAEADRQARDEAKDRRIARFDHLLGTLPEFSCLDRIAQRIEELENKIQSRLSRVTPANLFREMHWLQDTGRASAEVFYLIGALEYIVKALRTADNTKGVSELIVEMAEMCDRRFQDCSDCNQEGLYEAFGARDARDHLKLWSKP